MDNMQVSNGRI
jgi:hypothetical protein